MDNLHLTACLLLYFQRQDEALGLTWQSRRVRGLLWYYNKLREQSSDKLMTTAYLVGIINKGAAAIEQLTIQAETASSSSRENLLKIALEIQQRVKKADELLQHLTEAAK